MLSFTKSVKEKLKVLPKKFENYSQTPYNNEENMSKGE
ncbi:hypothetical protein CHY_2255 [Carboxydothermus hydrogenoformans Z-2901]|uniref:Uncharacterized protein n=1 Tax=Carboxydothermus hydrogenoformans (strain ATCC BAA-161 / DSM 6008 / Z-2901) TaxID=246194 RepID=Q3A9X0_CARHZ|nr:hypothetical protein CHY_2255 [Carboxydothermus hydrogenoformans Z-2901]